MSHVDEGRLHAYLDGELDAVGRADLEAHLAACRACRGELDEARALREESRFLLRGTGPTAVEEPPFGLVQARADRERGRHMGRGALRATTWAASLVVALGLGWFGRTLLGSGDQRPTAAATASRSDAEAAAALPSADSLQAEAGRLAGPATRITDHAPVASSAVARVDAPSPGGAGLAAPTVARVEADSSISAVVAPEEVAVEPAPTSAAKAAQRVSAGRAADTRVATVAPEPSSSLARAIRPDSVAPVRDAVNVAAETSAESEGIAAAVAWRAIDGGEAKKLLGHDPYKVPDLEVVGLETTAAVGADGQGDALVRVRQRLEDGGEIELYQRKEAASSAAAPRRGRDEPSGAVTPPPQQPTPRPPTAPTPTPSGKPAPAKPTQGNGGLGSILGLFGKDSKKETGKTIPDIPWLVRFTPEGDATMLAGSIRITAHGPLPKDRLRALLERVK